MEEVLVEISEGRVTVLEVAGELERIATARTERLKREPKDPYDDLPVFVDRDHPGIVEAFWLAGRLTEKQSVDVHEAICGRLRATGE